MVFDSTTEAEGIGIFLRFTLTPLWLFLYLSVLASLKKSLAFSAVWSLFYYVQLVRLIPLINLGQSDYILAFWKGVNKNFSQVELSTDKLEGFHSNFKALGITSRYLIENTPIVFAYVVLCGCSLFVCLCIYGHDSTNTQKRPIIVSALMRILLAGTFDLVLFSTIQLADAELTTAYAFVNIMFALLLVLVYALLPLVVVGGLCMKTPVLEEGLDSNYRIADSLECLVAEFAGKPSSRYYLFYALFVLMRLSAAAMIALLPDYPKLQNGFILVVEGIICTSYAGFYLLLARPYTQRHQTLLTFGVELCVTALLVTNLLYSQDSVPSQLLNAATVTIFLTGIIISLVKCGVSFKESTPNFYYATLCEDFEEAKVAPSNITHGDTVKADDEPDQTVFELKDQPRRGVLRGRNQALAVPELSLGIVRRRNDLTEIEIPEHAGVSSPDPARLNRGGMDVYPGVVDKYLARARREVQ